MVEIELDGRKVEVGEGCMIMHAAEKAGTYIPHFCYHKKLSIAANCRMCLVDVEKAPKPLPACATPVTQGMVVHTKSDKAIKAQQSVMEFLLINHPLDCPICDQGGECQLQDLAVGYGASSSRYGEEKRVVAHKDVGPLISMEEMTRCIHCTRCVRFGQEIAGVMELGMVNRGEHSEITTFVGKTVDSEVSGNMIDLCPVGALTSKPFRYSARPWELQRRKSVSPHDSLGANLIVQVKGGKVMRVLPLENEAVNECWLSDKERFSYEALDNADRLTKPMIKQDNKWIETEWSTALEYVAHGLRNIRHEHGADSLAAVATAHSTVEELYLLNKAFRGFGSDNVDFRLRQSDFALDGQVTPWLGMPIAQLSTLKRALVIGSFLRKDHPLATTRLRAATKAGLRLSVLGGSDEELLMKVAHKLVAAPSDWLVALSEVVVAIAADKNIAVPAGFENIEASEQAKAIAASLVVVGDVEVPGAILLGNAAAQHPQASKIHAAAQWIAEQTGCSFGYLVEAANSVGGHLVGATSGKKESLFATPKKAYVLLNAEPELDAANPQQAVAALQQAEMVVAMSAFKHGMDYADVLLPIAPFTETSGTFVNAEGRVQSFHAAARPLGETRPAWKVLRVLSNLMGITGVDYETSQEVLAAATGQPAGAMTHLPAERLSNRTQVQPAGASGECSEPVVASIYQLDGLVRRAPSLQLTADARAARGEGVAA